MSKTIRIIQSCNHMTRTESYEYKEAKVYRQERRQSEKSYSISSSKFMYYGNWTKETSNDKSYYINSSSTDRCSVFFYGDNACLYGLKHPDGGDISVYLPFLSYCIEWIYSLRKIFLRILQIFRLIISGLVIFQS